MVLRRFYRCVVVFVLIVLGWEVYSVSDPNRLDWLDWLFWAHQNYDSFRSSGKLAGVVMSPVQGLFGQSYPVNPLFNPLWLLAISMADPVIAHKVSSVVVFFLYGCVIWCLLTHLLQTNVYKLCALLICLNLFFDVIPVTEIYPLPKSNFDYFELMPPQNYLMVLALFMVLVCIRVKVFIFWALLNTVIVLLALLADPLYALIYFAPVVALLCVYYAQKINVRWKEVLYGCALLLIMFYIGLLEYPLLLKDTVGRGVFNEFLFHSAKRHDVATFAFQNKQNLLFVLFSTGVLTWDMIRNRDRMVISVLVTQIGFTLVGFIYLVTEMSFTGIPSLHALESTVVPIYVIWTAVVLEKIVKQRISRVEKHLQKTCGVVLLMFIAGKAYTMDYEVGNRVENFSHVPLMSSIVNPSQSDGVYQGSVSFVFGSRDGQLVKTNRLPKRYGIETVVYTQNNEHETEFYGTYKVSVALISYWLKGIATLEENNHLTNSFYLYFFRNLFMNKDDYYVTNMNLFTVPRIHLYPMLGVRELVSDTRYEDSTQYRIGNDFLYKTTFSNYNRGQYSPKIRVIALDANDAIEIMRDTSFDPEEKYIVLSGEESNLGLSGESKGEFRYENNSIHFFGETEGRALHVLPLLYSNCLQSEHGHKLIRVNLMLTGIVIDSTSSDRISYRGPPFNNGCLRADREDQVKYNLGHKSYPFPKDSSRPAIKRFLASPWH